MFPPGWAGLLRQLVRRRVAFVVSGGTGVGKTTLLGALLGEAPPAERVIVVEDVRELSVDQPQVVRLEARPANVEGAGEVTLTTLVRQALRMRPDRLVLGEARGAEVRELLAALNTGHEGGCGTLHANSAGDVVARFEALGALGGLVARSGARSARQCRGRRGARRPPGRRGGGSASGRDDRRGGSRSRRTTRGGGCPLDRSGRLSPRPRVAATLGASRYATERHVDRGHRGVVVTALVVALLLAVATWLLLRTAGSRPNALPGDPRPIAAAGRGDVETAGARRGGRSRGSPAEAEAEALDLLDALAPALRAGLPPATALRLIASSASPDGGPTSGPSGGFRRVARWAWRVEGLAWRIVGWAWRGGGRTRPGRPARRGPRSRVVRLRGGAEVRRPPPGRGGVVALRHVGFAVGTHGGDGVRCRSSAPIGPTAHRRRLGGAPGHDASPHRPPLVRARSWRSRSVSPRATSTRKRQEPCRSPSVSPCSSSVDCGPAG